MGKIMELYNLGGNFALIDKDETIWFAQFNICDDNLTEIVFKGYVGECGTIQLLKENEADDCIENIVFNTDASKDALQSSNYYTETDYAKKYRIIKLDKDSTDLMFQIAGGAGEDILNWCHAVGQIFYLNDINFMDRKVSGYPCPYKIDFENVKIFKPELAFTNI